MYAQESCYKRKGWHLAAFVDPTLVQSRRPDFLTQTWPPLAVAQAFHDLGRTARGDITNILDGNRPLTKATLVIATTF